VTTASKPPIISVVGSSGAGKTTLLERLIPQLSRLGFKVGTIKHDVHGFELDREGKDSWRHKEAGASTSVLSSPYQIGMVTDADHDTALDELASLLSHVDIILTEGYMRENKPKLEVFRPEVSEKPLCGNDEHLIALIGDAPADLGVPCFSPDDMEGLASFLVTTFRLVPAESDEHRKAVL
jgi:molybdopterin-guanine dinucleotide biosynthesis protein B